MKKSRLTAFISIILLTGGLLFAALVIFPFRQHFFTQLSLAGDPALYDEMIEEAAVRHGVSPNLVRAVICQESDFQSRIVGDAGEIGLMQITPIAAKDWCRLHGVEYRFRGMLSDPRLNIEIGTWYLSRGLSRWGEYDDKEVLALAEYNAGRKRIIENGWAPEDKGEKAINRIGFSSTKAYIIRVLNYRESFDQNDGKSL